MRNSFLYSSGSKKTVINNNTIEDLAYKAHYNGSEGEMIFRNNNNAYYIKVNNDDIQDILGKHPDDKSLEIKLKNLINTKKRTKKNTLSGKTTRKKSPNKSKTKSKKSPSISKTKTTRRKSPNKSKTKSKKSPSISKTKTTRRKSYSNKKKTRKRQTVLEDLF
jgi:hypothetical protein